MQSPGSVVSLCCRHTPLQPASTALPTPVALLNSNAHVVNAGFRQAHMAEKGIPD